MIASVGQHHGVVNHGSCGQMRWNLKNHSYLTVARHLREKTHTSMLVVTSREGEGRGTCSAALKEMLNIIKDRIEERSVVVLVLNNESAIWKDATMRTLLRGNQLNYIDVEGMRVITNNRSVAEEIKSDKVENVAASGVEIEEFGKVGNSQSSKRMVVDGIEIGKLEKLENL